MTDRDLETRLRAAQRAEAEHADPGALLERVHSIPERVEPQRRHWWSGLRNGAPRGADPGGRADTGRRHHMILATGAIGVAIIAVGGIFGLSTVTRQQDQNPAAEGGEAAAPVAWSGAFVPGACPQEATEILIGDVSQERGWTCQPTAVRMTDDRLTGRVTWSENRNEYAGGVFGPEGEGFAVGFSGLVIENEGGTWRQLPIPDVQLQDVRLDDPPYVLIGEGGYDGLIAVGVPSPEQRVGPVGVELTGYIIEGQLPPVPDILSDE